MFQPPEPHAADTPDAARQTLAALCWPDGARRCPRCATPEPYALSGGRLRCSGCRYTFHDFTGRWLNLAGISPAQWLAVAEAFTRELSTKEIAEAALISPNTAFKAMTVLRLALTAQGADALQLLGPETPLGQLLRSGRLAAQGESQPPPGGLYPVYGILARGGWTFVDLVPELSSETLLHFNSSFRLRVARFGHILLTDRYRDYEALACCAGEGMPYHYLRRHEGQPFAETGGSPFWSFARDRLRRFKGLSWRRFPLYLKELEFRFNRRGQDFAPEVLQALCSPVPKLAQNADD